jgi:hypothetical protein
MYCRIARLGPDFFKCKLIQVSGPRLLHSSFSFWPKATLLNTFLAQVVHLHGCIFHECPGKSSIPRSLCISSTVPLNLLGA